MIPYPRGLRMQAVHTGDVASAVVAAVERPVGGAVNLAGDGVLRRDEVAELLGARTVEVPAAVVRSALGAGFRTRAAPVPAELFDALLRVPLLDTRRARDVLDWEPRHTAADAVAAFLSGATLRAGSDLPPLHR